MEVIKFLNENNLEKLKEEFAIKISESDQYPELYVLNYNQIDSPKNHPVVKNCRSLVVSQKEDNSWYVVSAAFDRFFNYGENGDTPDVSKLTCFEKVDGSLVSVFYYKGEWLYRTKSVIMPEGAVNAFDVKWNDFIEDCLDWENFKIGASNYQATYIFEVVGEANRVVTKYTENKAYLLAMRDNSSLEYYDIKDFQHNYESPKSFSFNSTQECLDVVKSLPDLQEGYVAYENNFTPVCKIKSPSYVAAHRIRGEGLTPNRIMDLVIMNEQDEYTAVFPEDKDKFAKYVFVWNNVIPDTINRVWDMHKNITSQKDFAFAVKGEVFSSVLFLARKNASIPCDELHLQRDSFKIKLLTEFMNKEK